MVTVFAQMMDRGDMGDGSGHWWWVIGLAVLVVLVLLVVVAVTRGTASHTAAAPPPSRRSAEDVLADRFARGEIDEADFRRRRDALRD